MLAPNILFYCGWGGLGHISRAHSIIKNLPPQGSYRVVSPEKWVFSSPAKNFEYIKLPRPESRIRLKDEKFIIEDYTPGAKDKKGYQKHLHAFISALKKINPQLVVVDNPAEIALLSKYFGYKTVVIYESLETEELRWKLAWQNVDKVLAPYPKEFLNKADFPYLKNTFCCGGFTRYDNLKIPSKAEARDRLGLEKKEKYILLTTGKGRKSEGVIPKICRNVSHLGYKIILTYPEKEGSVARFAANHPYVIHIPDAGKKMDFYLSSADFLITGAGYSSLMEACRFRKPTIAVPLERIYNEQKMKAEIMHKMGAVICLSADSISKENIDKAVKKAKGKKYKEKMRRAQSKMVPGNGATKAAGMLVNILKNE